jgi:hypothetical protein
MSAIEEEDPTVASDKVSECLGNGSSVVACQSQACDNYEFKYDPVYPTPKQAPACVAEGYAALQAYVKGCWTASIGETDPVKVAEQVKVCLD